MNGFTVMVVIVTESLAVSFFIWLITRCKSLFTGFAAACSGVAICWTVCRLYCADHRLGHSVRGCHRNRSIRPGNLSATEEIRK